jgi:hypothetical protein
MDMGPQPAPSDDSAVRPRLVHRIDVPYAAELVHGAAAYQWSRQSSRVVAVTDDVLLVYERAALLRGVVTPVARVAIPWPGRTEVSITPDGTLVILAGPDRIRAVRLDAKSSEGDFPGPDEVAGQADVADWDFASGPDPFVAWELPHDPWPHGSPSGPAEVSPDGAHVSAVVPALHVDAGGTATGPATGAVTLWSDDDNRHYIGEWWLLLNAATGVPTTRLRMPSVSSQTCQLWHPRQPFVAVSAWTAWWSWSTWWIRTDGDKPRVTDGPRMRRVTDILPDGDDYLSVRLAELMTNDDTINNATVHRLSDHVETAVIDLVDLDAADEDEELTDCRCVTPGGDVIGVVTTDQSGGRPATHWWCDSLLRRRARIAYPISVTCDLAPVGDGTWLTHDGHALHRWAPPDEHSDLGPEATGKGGPGTKI